jgi:transcriptional regulator with XRE-family HTH domain
MPGRGWPAGVPKRAWTPKRFGEMIGVSEPQVSRYLDGTYYPTVQLMKRIEEILDWPVGDQVTLVPKEGTDPVYGMALKDALDHKFREMAVHDWQNQPPRRRLTSPQRGQGWSANAVAARLGINATSIWRYVDGQRYPPLETMRAIARVYDFPVGDQLDLVPTEGRNRDYADALIRVISEKEGVHRYGTTSETLDD